MALYTQRMSILSLCSGIGGVELGLKLAVPNSRTICYCEREKYCIQILAKRIKEGFLDDAPIWSDVGTFDGKPWCGKVSCIAASYPCQPFSTAGKKLGKEDERWLWPDIARIVREVQPEWCFFENVSAHLRMGFEQVHDDLREMGYRVAAGLFTAKEVDAGHERERLFILAHTFVNARGSDQGTTVNMDGEKSSAESQEPETRGFAHAFDNGSTVMDGGHESYTVWPPMELGFPPGPDNKIWRDFRAPEFFPATIVEPDVFGMVDGDSSRLDRLRACGNAVVPLVAGFAFRTLANAL